MRSLIHCAFGAVSWQHSPLPVAAYPVNQWMTARASGM
jgi:hypothetical protein